MPMHVLNEQRWTGAYDAFAFRLCGGGASPALMRCGKGKKAQHAVRATFPHTNRHSLPMDTQATPHKHSDAHAMRCCTCSARMAVCKTNPCSMAPVALAASGRDTFSSVPSGLLLVKTHARICEATGSTLQCLYKHDPIRSECHGMDVTHSDGITCAQARGGPHAGGKTLTMLHTLLHITCKLSPHTTRIQGHYELTVCTDNSTAPMPHPLH